MEDLPQLDIQENIEELCKEDTPIVDEPPPQDLTDVSQPLPKVEAESIFEKPSNRPKPKPKAKPSAASKKAVAETRRRNLEKARQKREIERRVKAEMKREKEEAIIRAAKELEDEEEAERPPTPTPPPKKKVSPSPMPSQPQDEFSNFMKHMEKYKVMKHEWVQEQKAAKQKSTPKPVPKPAPVQPAPVIIQPPNPYSSAFNW